MSNMRFICNVACDMTCVWDSLIKGLQYALVNDVQGMTPVKFVQYLKKHNVPVHNVNVNHNALREQEVEENHKAISELDENNLMMGYLCSASDPLLILICSLFCVNIRVHFVSTDITYSVPNATHEIILSNSKTHMTLLKVIKFI